MSIEGKIANQSVNKVASGVLCAKCGKLMELPSNRVMASDCIAFNLSSYIGTSHFIYESKSGHAVVYCSKYCRNKHNHRFTK